MIYYNARFLTQLFSGVQRFSWELTKRLINSLENLKIIAPQKKFWKRDWSYSKVIETGKKSGVFWEQVELPLFLKKESPFLINPGNTAPLLYERNLVINHGLAWKRCPYAFSRKFRIWYDFLIPRVLKKALLIFAVSEFCKQELLEFYNLEEEKVFVLYPGISEKFRPLGLKRKNFILYVGNLQPYKNLKTLIKAFEILVERDFEIELWIAGIRDEKVFKEEVLKEVKEKAKPRIRFLGFKEDEELVYLYNQARCLVLPSFYETFGFPVVEAMACGCPVVTSSIPALKEIAGDSVLFFNPNDVEELSFVLEKVLTEETLRENLIKRGYERVKRFSWENTVRDFLEILRKHEFI